MYKVNSYNEYYYSINSRFIIIITYSAVKKNWLKTEINIHEPLFYQKYKK